MKKGAVRIRKDIQTDKGLKDRSVGGEEKGMSGQGKSKKGKGHTHTDKYRIDRQKCWNGEEMNWRGGKEARKGKGDMKTDTGLTEVLTGWGKE